jgi:hypothetical protein
MYPQQHMTITDESQADVVIAVLAGETVSKCALREGCDHWARKPGAPGYYYCRCHWFTDGFGGSNASPGSDHNSEFNCDGSRVTK